MIHVDEVIELFSEHYPDAEVDASADKVDAVITSNGLSVKVTFIERTQVFNLDNGRGKVYTATNFEALQSNIETFFYMENDFKPKSQAVCSVFKNAFLKDSTVVIKGIRGGSNQSFTAIYSVSGSSDDLIIKAVELSIFEVEYQGSSYIYSIDEAGNIYLMPSINYYSDELHTRYGDSTFVDVARTGENTFSFKYEDGLIIDITALLSEDYKIQVSVERVEYNGVELQMKTGIVELENVCSLEELYTNFSYLKEEQLDYTDELDSLMENFEEPVEEVEEPVEETEEPVEEAEEPVEEVEEPIEEVEEPVEDAEEIEEPMEEAEEPVEEVEEPVEEVEEPVEEIEEPVSSVEEDDFNIILITGVDNKPAKVRFVFPNKFMDMNINIAISLGIPVNSIAKTEQQILKRGMLVTSMELERRIFAVDVSSDKVLCSNLVDKLFS